MISKAISAAAITLAAISLGACSSSETPTLANGLIAGATLTDKDNATAGVKIGQTQGTTFTFTPEPNKAHISWSTGPYSDKTRTFILVEGSEVDDVRRYIYLGNEGGDDNDNGVLFATGVEDAGFALGAMYTDGKKDAAAGATHFGNTPTNIPNSGTVTYEGINAGLIANNGETGDRFTAYDGTSHIEANFGNGKVEGTLTGLSEDITFTGRMSQGNAVYAANNRNIHYGGAAVSSNSKLIGGFYGDGAAATAGVYDVSLGDTPIRAIGGFVGTNEP